MKVFLDTSALVKKYLSCENDEKLDELLSRATEISISYVTRIEYYSVIFRKLHGRMITKKECEFLLNEFNVDYRDFYEIICNDSLFDVCQRILKKHPVKSLDLIQYSSFMLSDSKYFVTSDRKLSNIAKRDGFNVVYV